MYLIIIIILIWILSACLSYIFFENWTKSASFGDTFGAINSLFSGLALAGIIYTIHLQKNELALQRQELRYTRKELKRTALAQEESAKSMSTQIRLTNFPFIEFDSVFRDNERCLILSNNSNNVAYDIFITIFSFLSDDEYPHKEFLEKYVNRDDKYSNLSLVDESLWSLSDVGYYPGIPINKKIIIPVKFLIDDGIYSLFLEYRDILGNNYSNLIHFNIFGEYETNENKPFSGIRVNPEYPIKTKRIGLNLKTNENPPDYVKDYIKYKKSSIRVSNLINSEPRSNDFKWKLE